MEISADVREAVLHQRHVCDDALYKSTFTYRYLLTILCIDFVINIHDARYLICAEN